MTTRVVICGGPRTGKTTAAYTYAQVSIRGGLPEPDIVSTDTWIPAGFSGAIRNAVLQLDKTGPWVMEGVVTATALRRWLASHSGQPCDAVIIRSQLPGVTTLTPRQSAMLRGVETIIEEIIPLLARRGVDVFRGVSL